MSGYQVMVGACGWRHPQWDTSYYPEDLPSEWQLAYYGNEYPVVLIPAGYWAQGLELLAQSIEESDERPRFVCEWTLQVLESQQTLVSSALALLGERVEAVMLSALGQPNPTKLEAIRHMALNQNVVLDLSHADTKAWLAAVTGMQQGRGVSVCWHGDKADQACLDQGPVAMARIVSSGQSPRSLREILEALMASAGQRQAILLFDGEPPDTEVIDQAEVVLNLL